MIVPHAVLARNWRAPRSRRPFLLGTAIPNYMSGKQMRDLQTQLGVIALAWDGVRKAMRKAREQHGLR